MGIRDLNKIKKSLHMKFVWRLLTVDNLWARFLKAKYVKPRISSQPNKKDQFEVLEGNPECYTGGL